MRYHRKDNNSRKLASVPLAGGAEGRSWGSWNLGIWRRLGQRPLRRERCPVRLELQEFRGGAPQRPPPTEQRLRLLRRRRHPVVLILLSGCDEAGAGSVERIQKLESTAAGKRNKSLLPPPASGSPSSAFYSQNPVGAGWKRRNWFAEFQPQHHKVEYGKVNTELRH